MNAFRFNNKRIKTIEESIKLRENMSLDMKNLIEKLDDWHSKLSKLDAAELQANLITRKSSVIKDSNLREREKEEIERRKKIEEKINFELQKKKELIEKANLIKKDPLVTKEELNELSNKIKEQKKILEEGLNERKEKMIKMWKERSQTLPVYKYPIVEILEDEECDKLEDEEEKNNQKVL